jgi:GAF domain-containing protein
MHDEITRRDNTRLSAAQAYSELARIDFANHDLRAVLGKVAEVAKRTLIDTGDVSVTLMRGSRAYTAAFTGPIALELDETQYQRGYGPCLDAAVSAQLLHIEDMSAETRWPDYAPVAAAQGIRSSVSVGLPIQEAILGALNLYERKPRFFDEAALDVVSNFAAYAAVAAANAHLYEDAATQARQMHEAMEHRAVIEQAKGIIMGDRRCSAQEAFDILRQLSNASNRKLRDVAATLVTEAQKRPSVRRG